MKCRDCGGSLQSPHGDGLVLECEACALFAFDCQCRHRLGYTPRRWVHCLACDRLFIEAVDTTTVGWRGAVV